jgi:glycosyltransferase involved in cell wall biosynthesis
VIRLLVIGHAYIVPANRGKIDRLARELDLAVGLVCPNRWPEPEFGVRVLANTDTPYPVFGVPMRGAGNVRRSWFDGARLAGALDAFRPDVVWIEQEPASLAAFQCVRAAKKRGAKVVLFTWDNVAGANRFPLEWIARYAGRRASRVLAGNAGARTRLASRGLAATSEVLPQIGVDADAFAAADGRAARDRLGLSGFVVGFAGRLLARKGVFDLLDAFALLPGDGTLVYIGDGPEGGPLRARAEALGLGARVRFVPGVPHEAMPAHLAALSALVLPSRTTKGWAEQFGHVLVEAMAAGVPVIGSDSGAIPEVIGDAGLVFPEGDARGLAAILETLRDDGPKRRGLAERGRARVRERFSDEAIARRTAEVAREVTR